MKEKYFDGSSDRNITINKNSKSSASVSISQSGYYIIEARVKGTDLKKYFHIAKHDKPEYSLPGSEMGEGTEPLTKLGTKTGNPYTVSVSFGTNSTLRKRLIALTRVNYRQMTANFDFRRIDVRLVHAEQDTLKANRGDSSVIALPELYNYMGVSDIQLRLVLLNASLQVLLQFPTNYSPDVFRHILPTHKKQRL